MEEDPEWYGSSWIEVTEAELEEELATTTETGLRDRTPNLHRMVVRDQMIFQEEDGQFSLRRVEEPVEEPVEEDVSAPTCEDTKLMDPKEPCDPDYLFNDDEAGRKRKRSSDGEEDSTATKKR